MSTSHDHILGEDHNHKDHKSAGIAGLIIGAILLGHVVHYCSIKEERERQNTANTAYERLPICIKRYDSNNDKIFDGTELEILIKDYNLDKR